MGRHMISDRPLRLVIAGGGTGGHVLPAMAVLEVLAARGIAIDPLWIGSVSGVEGETARHAGIPFAAIQTGKLRRYVDRKTPADLARIPVGLGQAWNLLRRHRPDVVLGTGGFVSVPTVLAAARSIPVLTHEQTAILGLATRITMRFADVLAVSYEETARLAAGSRARARVVVTGNPVRPSLLDGDVDRGRSAFGFTPDLPVVYVTGGARGASPLNDRIGALLPDLLVRTQMLHQTGPAGANDDAQAARARRATWPEEIQRRYQVREYVRDEMADVYAAAALVIGRAGAGTVAELARLGKPAILIPLPGTGGDEQTHNARLLADAGAAIVLPQAEATPDRLRTEIKRLLADPETLATMSARARAIGRSDAADRLTDELLALAATRWPTGS